MLGAEQIFFFVSLIFFFAAGVPVAFGLLFSSFIYLLTMDMPLISTAQMMTQATDNTPLLCLPFFILTGEIMNTGGVTRRIVRFTSAITGRVTGGLAIVNVGASMIFAGMSGSALADCSALGTMLIPAMEKEGYDKEFSCAVTAASSIIGPVIPPSGGMVILGALAGVSIGSLFLGGIVPGFLMGLTMMILVYIMAKRRNYPKSPVSSWRELFRSFIDAFPAILTPLIIIFGIYSGAFTPTEAAVVAAVYAMVISVFFYKDLRLKDLPAVLAKAGKVTAGIMFILASASLFAWIMAMEQMPQHLFSAISSISDNKHVIYVLIVVFLLFIGLFMDNVPAMIILVPVLFPVANNLGINPVHFGVIMVLSLLLGLLTPPLGFVLFAISSIGNTSITRLSRALIPFILLLVGLTIILIFVPSLILYIPLELAKHWG